MVKNVIFDMGNVLIEWDPDKLIARLGVSGEDAKLLRWEVFDGAEWVALDHGTMGPEQALPRILPRLPERLHAAAEHFVRFWWQEDFWPIEGIEALIRELDALGCRLYILSNATSCLHEYFPRLPGSDRFRGLIVSADWKLLKPGAAIYEKLFAEYGLRPEECFFIDDNPMNIETALCLGMQGAVFFRDMKRLRRELRAAGIPVQAE